MFFFLRFFLSFPLLSIISQLVVILHNKKKKMAWNNLEIQWLMLSGIVTGSTDKWKVTAVYFKTIVVCLVILKCSALTLIATLANEKAYN